MIYINEDTDLVPVYIEELDSCHDLPSIQALLVKYSEISPDLGEVEMNTQKDFNEFRAGLLLERQGESAGEVWCKKYASIALPKLMMLATIISNQYMVPWGVAYQQLLRSLQSEKTQQETRDDSGIIIKKLNQNDQTP
jgi:hypothetical protein